MKEVSSCWIRHGDVILERVSSLDVSVKKVKEVVLAEGEVTGHFHELKGDIGFGEVNGLKCVEVFEDAELSHQEHDTIVVPKGKYVVMIQREVDLLGEVRQVMD